MGFGRELRDASEELQARQQEVCGIAGGQVLCAYSFADLLEVYYL